MASKANLRRMSLLSLLLGEESSFRSHLAGQIYGAVRFPRRTMRQIAKAMSGHDTLVQVDESLMRVPVDMLWAFRDGDYYEKNVTHWLLKLVSSRRGMVFYDVGANYGYYCLKLARVVGHIHAFEPVANSYRILLDNLSRNGLENVTAHKVALGETNGIREMHIYTSSGNNSLFPVQFARYHSARMLRREAVNVVALDSVLRGAQLEPPDVVKVDIEGGELWALKGARDTIDNYQPALLIECLEPLCATAGYRRSDLLSELDQHHYAIYGLAEDVDDVTAYARRDLASVDLGHIIALPKSWQ
jgi:FkbM family methyltransferase